MLCSAAILLAVTQVTSVYSAPTKVYGRSPNLAVELLKGEAVGATVTVTVTAGIFHNHFDGEILSRVLVLNDYLQQQLPATGATTAPAEEEEAEEAKTRANGTLGTAFALKGANELQAISFKGSAVSFPHDPTPFSILY